MNKEETKKAIAVMQAWVDEVPLQVRDRSSRLWLDGVIGPRWNWEEWQWRIKPQPVGIEVWSVVAIDGNGGPHILGTFANKDAATKYASQYSLHCEIVHLTGTYTEDTP